MLKLASIAPDLPALIETAYTPIFGFYIADEPLAVSITANGMPLNVTVSDRNDLLKLHPDGFCQGFYTAYKTDIKCGIVNLAVHLGEAEVARSRTIVTPEAMAAAMISRKAWVKNRKFALDHLICINCAGTLAGSVQPAQCPQCGTQFDCSTNAVSSIPLGTYEIPKTINTSFCGYHEDERDLIESARRVGGKVLDFGAGFRGSTDDSVISVEIADMPSTDLVSISDRIPFADNSFESAMTLHVLEHVKKPWEIARELIRVVKPGGMILSTVPYICPVHGFPYHFFNMTPWGLRSLFEDCRIVSHTMKTDAHPINGLKQLLGTYHGSLINEEIKEQFGRVTIDEIVNTDLAALLGLDWSLALGDSAKWEMPAHSTLVVQKPV